MNKEQLQSTIEAGVKERFGDNAPYILAEYEFRQELDYILWAFDRPSLGKYPITCEQRIEQAIEKAQWVHDHILTPANIQIGDGVTVRLWSDAYAATVIKRTALTVTVRRDKATLDPNFKPEWIAGGFAGHCVNQDEQTYTYEEDPNGEIFTFRWSRKYGSYGTPGNLRLTKGRREFYDYNF